MCTPTTSSPTCPHVAAATGLGNTEERAAGFDAITAEFVADDHKRYYPGATELRIQLTGDRATGRLPDEPTLGGAAAVLRADHPSRPITTMEGGTEAGRGTDSQIPGERLGPYRSMWSYVSACDGARHRRPSGSPVTRIGSGPPARAAQ